MAVDDKLQSWLSDAPTRVKRKLARTIADEANRLASAIKARAPRGKTGNLANSVQVRRRRHELDLEVTAGGDMTTVKYERSTDYSSEVSIGSGDTAGRSKVSSGSGSGVTYDYSRAVEFSTADMPAQPFFWPVVREMGPGIRRNIDKAIEEALNG